jgi:hypothetical protein
MAGGYQSLPLIQFSAIGEAWRLYKRHWFVWSLAMLIVTTAYSIVTAGALSILDVRGVKPHGGFRLFLMPAGGMIPFVISTTVSTFFMGGMIRMAANQVEGREPRIDDLFSIADVWFDLILVAFLVGFASALGFMLCFVPGLIVSGLLMLAIPLVVQGRQPATGAIIQSWNALKSQWLVAGSFNIVLIVASMSGIMLCGLGLLVTGPLYCLGVTILYRDFFAGPAIGSWKKHPEPFPEF